VLICALESRASFEGEEQQDEAEKGQDAEKVRHQQAAPGERI
jgi:hypothetical protein